MMINALCRVWQAFHMVFFIWSYFKYLFIQSLPNSRPSSLKHTLYHHRSGVDITTLMISYLHAVSFSWSPDISTHAQSSGIPHLQCRDGGRRGGRRAQCLHASHGLSPLQLTVHLMADFGVGGARMGKMDSVTCFSLLNCVNPGPHYHGPRHSPQLSSCQLRDPPGVMTP